MRQKQPTGNAADPVNQVKLNTTAVCGSGIDHQISGVDQCGVEREADNPPGQSATGQEPVLACLGAAAFEEGKQNDRPVESQHDNPVKGRHGSSGAWPSANRRKSFRLR